MRTQTVAFFLIGSLVSGAVLAQTTSPPQGTKNPPAAMGTEGAEVSNPAPAKDASAPTPGNESTKATTKHKRKHKAQPTSGAPRAQS